MRPGRYTTRCTSYNFVCLGGAITDPPDLNVEIVRRVQRAWGCNRELHNQPAINLQLLAEGQDAQS